LTGIATLTRAFRRAVGDSACVLLETRKTAPGFRRLDKYAVRAGGGENHRMGLFDQILAKENHFTLAGCDRGGRGFGAAIDALLAARPSGMPVEVEVETLEQFEVARATDVDVILLDNMEPALLAEAVRRRNLGGRRTPLLEASGGVTLTTVAAYAASGVDRLSVGALTHSVRAPDLTLLFE
jgi:nicotinate-nucleotide pyrophosphorylase (carboxylating)